MEPPKFERCSILLTFQKLMISVSNRTTELWTKQPRRDGGRASGPSEEAPRGGPATFRLRADHTQLGRAVLFCSLSQLAKPVAEGCFGSFSDLRAVQTDVRFCCDSRHSD